MVEVVDCSSARDAWLALEASFSHSSKTREIQLKDELQLMQRGSRTVTKYARSFRSFCDQLTAIGKPVDDTDKVHWFLCGLGSDYKIFSTSILSQFPMPSFANLIPQALSHELFSRSLHGDLSSLSAFVAHRGSSFSDVSGRPKSAISSSVSGNFSRSSVVTCQWCNKERHTAKKCHKLNRLLKKAKGDGLIEAFAVTSIDPSITSEWYTNTGATSHMTNDVNALDNFVPYTGNQRVYVGNGNSMSIFRIGKINSIVASHPLPLSDVLLDLTTRKVMGVGRCKNGLYVLDRGHNAIAERKHRHITETGLTLMFHSNMPLHLWVDSFSTACYLINRLPSPVLDGGTDYITFDDSFDPSLSSDTSTSSVIPAHRLASTSCVPCADSHIPSPPSEDFLPPSSSVPSSSVIALDIIPPASSSSRPSPTINHPMVTRARMAHLAIKEPHGFKSAIKQPKWLSAMDDEIATKLQADGSVERHKARLVAQGFFQKHGIDFDATFSPVVRPAIVRIILTLAAMHNWALHQLDVKNAFLHGFLLEEAPQAWFQRFSHFLLGLGFLASRVDSSLFVYHGPHGVLYLLLYVDDMIITSSNQLMLRSLINRLAQEFSMKDLGDLHYFLGIEVIQHDKGIFLSQAKYALDLLTRADMVDYKLISTPFVVGSHLTESGTPHCDATEFWSLAGALQYLTLTRPDLSYNVNSICQYMHAPTTDHFRALKRILCYVKGTYHYGLQLSKHSSSTLIGYSDADWAGCPVTRRSITGYAAKVSSHGVLRSKPLLLAQVLKRNTVL
ncbi:uncharacterized protein [Populus alba]|uniref:uncharacterized protein n=1 Tax=Populus alba TaxID=43335 RepID=UPI003CC77F6A